MPETNRHLVAPTTNSALEVALLDKLQARRELGGSLGGLEPLAVRLGLIQNTLSPRLVRPQLLMFVADHGLAVEGIQDQQGRSTSETVRLLLTRQLPVSLFAQVQGMGLTVIDCGLAENLVPHNHLLVRKMAYGTRNARVTSAMTLDQAHAAIRAGVQIGEQLRGNMTVLAALGVGANESAALVLSRLSGSNLRDLVTSGPTMTHEALTQRMRVLMGAQARHREVDDPVAVLAAMGGYEMAVMVGVMLVAASRRHLLLIDGLPSCAALLLATKISQAVTDYCVFCRSHSHRGLDHAMNLFRASALLEMGLESADGTGAALAWPLVKSAAALLGGADGGPDEPAPVMTPEPYVETQIDASPLGGAPN